MADLQKMVPVTSSTVFGIGPVIIIFIALAMILGLILYLFTKNYHKKYEQGGKQMRVIIKNDTNQIYTLKVPDNTKRELLPQKEIILSLSQHDVLSAVAINKDESISEHVLKLTNSNIKNVYITVNGFRTDLSGSQNVTFINDSHISILFVERSSSGGRRYPKFILLPGQQISNKFVGKRTTWEVVSPSQENIVIAKITIGGKPSKIIFNGNNIIAE